MAKKTDEKKENLSGLDRYVIDTDPQTLSRLQKKKTSLTTLSFFVCIAAMLMPASDISFLEGKIFLTAAILVLYVVTIGFGFYIVTQNSRTQKICAEKEASKSPRGGFKNRTYLSVYIYPALLTCLTAAQIVFAVLKPEVEYFIALAMFAAALILAVYGAAVLYNALKCAVFVKGGQKETDEGVLAVTGADENVQSETGAAQSGAENQTDEGGDDFYGSEF